MSSKLKGLFALYTMWVSMSALPAMFIPDNPVMIIGYLLCIWSVALVMAVLLIKESRKEQRQD